MSSSSSSRVTILSLLDAYCQTHESGAKSQKACTWQLTKARQNKGRRGALVDGVLLAENVREELRATKILKKHDNIIKIGETEPSLLKEDDGEKTLKTTTSLTLGEMTPVRLFSLVDALEYEKELAANQNKKDDNVGTETTSGLRRRKGGNDKDNEAIENNDPKNDWTVVDNNDSEAMEKEERLRKADPLDLFGAMPPQELRNAQKEAKRALEYYVGAANLLAAIQERLVAADKKESK